MSSSRCCRGSKRDGAEDGGVPARRAGRGRPGPRDRRAGAALGAAGGVHHRGSRHDGDSATRGTRRARLSGPLAGRADAQLRHARRSRSCAARAPRSGTRRPPLPRPARRHRGQRARPRPPGRGRGRHAQIAHARPHLEPLPHTSRSSRSPRSSSSCWAADARVFFTNSGTEANEAAFKIARRTGRPHIVAAENAFHGRTMGALALTGQPANRDAVRAVPPGVSHVPYGDVAALNAAVDPTRPRCSSNPSWARRGVDPAARGLLAAAREITAARGALLVLDEMQTGIGRTGAWFAHRRGHRARRRDAGEGPRRRPADRCVHRLRGGGVAARAGQHGTTFGGNPVCCAAALAVLDTIAGDGLLENVHARRRGASPRASRSWTTRWSRGSAAPGLLLGSCSPRRCPPRSAAAARDAGFLVQRRARRGPARAAADHHRRAGRGVPRRAARDPGRRRAAGDDGLDGPST